MPLVEAGSKVNFITGYTADANDHIDYGHNVWVAQSFPIAATSRIFRCSFRQWSTEVGMPYYYALRHALADGTPTGENIAETHISPQIKETSSPGKWYHIDFTSFPELTPGNYALLAYAQAAHFTTGQHHGAQSNPRLYLPGKAFRSTNSGSTWAEIPDTNSLFQIWGYQEPPPPPPPDAIGNWLLTSITYQLTTAGMLITLTTDIPCHLFKRETTTVPQKHVNPIVTRGAVIGTYIDQCFVAYTDIEQQEQADTLIHTFVQEPWPCDETRWFYFWGTKLLALMPSASPIFNYTRICPPTLSSCTNGPGSTTIYSASGDCQRFSHPFVPCYTFIATAISFWLSKYPTTPQPLTSAFELWSVIGTKPHALIISSGIQTLPPLPTNIPTKVTFPIPPTLLVNGLYYAAVVYQNWLPIGPPYPALNIHHSQLPDTCNNPAPQNQKQYTQSTQIIHTDYCGSPTTPWQLLGFTPLAYEVQGTQP
jgi:hypothetical protein